MFSLQGTITEQGLNTDVDSQAMEKCPNNSHDASILLVKFITFYWDVLLRGAVTTILSVINMNKFMFQYSLFPC